MAQSNGRSPGQAGLRSQAGNANPPAENENINPNVPINLQPNVSVKVDVTGLDTFVPVIPEVRTEDTKEIFKVKYLTKLEGEPTHDWLETVKKELGCNSLTVKCSFGGGKLSCL